MCIIKCREIQYNVMQCNLKLCTLMCSIREREANFSDWQCNVGCSCDRDSFDPLCGDDGITYFSPCYAACSTACVNDVSIRVIIMIRE